LQKRLARLAGWLLFPVPGVVLLADQPLAGFPAFLAQRFGRALLEGHGRFRFTDPDGWLAPAPLTTTSQNGFPVAFEMDDWCFPALAKSSSTVREALGVKFLLSEYFLRTEGARLRGWGSKQLDSARSEFHCPVCRGRGQSYVHPQLAVPCPRCNGRGWRREAAKAEDRGLRWLDLGQQSIAELADFFSSHPTLGQIFTTAVELQLGGFRLDENLARLPIGVRMLAPLAFRLAQSTPAQTPLHIGLATAGWNPLDAGHISSRIERLRPGHGSLERREHHPLFAPL